MMLVQVCFVPVLQLLDAELRHSNNPALRCSLLRYNLQEGGG